MNIEVTLLLELKEGLLLACQPSGITLIIQGRQRVLALPREYVLKHIEPLAAQLIDITDYWEYRRLLELAEMLDSELVQHFVAWGLNSEDPDVLEAAMDYKAV